MSSLHHDHDDAEDDGDQDVDVEVDVAEIVDEEVEGGGGGYMNPPAIGNFNLRASIKLQWLTSRWAGRVGQGQASIKPAKR
ncbi:hypothetical protein AWZ03_012501 [Drosophila navojoa]|uniref:Uncharacterized protein n=1 Tax=Drosophila navojoa TaxID=7232 RepID=A0A484AXE8_DRONA|nr:hypothetical protein AWZ03_012501 [Drosophila navojoa]